MGVREIRFVEALREALDACLAANPAVYVMGLGVPDPKGVFGTTLGLQEKYGASRVMDMPTSENAMTGVAIGSALVGMRPVLVHQRLDFALLAVDQMVNQAAKWHYMFAGQSRIPLVIRLVVGRGWGQGPQHSQSLQAWFAHVPGLKVVMPATPSDAKGLLIASVEDNNPVIFIEHRWLHGTFGHVPEGLFRVPLGQARIARNGSDLTIVATSYWVLEALRAAQSLADAGVDTEVVDVRTVRPLDVETIVASVRRTGRLIVVDGGWPTCGFASEVICVAAERALGALQAPPRRVTLLDCPVPTTSALSGVCYPTAGDLATHACDMLGVSRAAVRWQALQTPGPDVPDPAFAGPF